MRLPRLLLSAGLVPAALAAVVVAQAPPPPVPPVAGLPAAKKAEDKPADKKAKTTDPVELDKQALTAAGLKPDDPAGLIEYLKSRTLNDADLGKINDLIKKMGGENKFDDRIAAQDQLVQIGGKAVAPLRIAAKDDSANADPEVVYRAKQAIRRMEKEKALGADITAAVIRTLGRSRDPQALPTVLGFLPLADSPAVVDVIQEALRETAAGPDGKPNDLLVKALGDENALRRRVAALALIEGGTPGKPLRFPELQPKFVEMAKVDKDPAVRFVLARTLVADARVKDAVPVLIDLMPDMTRGQSWQAEELLVQIAGKDAPPERCKHTRNQSSPDKELASNKQSREKTRDAWKKWWDGAKDKTDLTKIDVRQTMKGHFAVVTQFWGGVGQQIAVTEYGTDDKVRLTTGFQVNNSVLDVALDGADRVLSLEYGAAQVSVRDLSGKVAATWTIPVDKNARNNFQPKGVSVRENGNVFVVHANGVAEFDKDGKEVLKYNREVNKQPAYDLVGATRLKSGEIVLQLNTNKVMVIDEKGKEVDGKKAFNVGSQNQYQKSLIQQSGDDSVLVVEQNQIMEYNLKTGKAEGTKIQNVYSNVGQKLPNGNVLYSDNNYYPPRIVEKTPKGEEVWAFYSRDQNSNLIKAMVR